MNVKKGIITAAIAGIALWGFYPGNVCPVDAAQEQETSETGEFVIQDGKLLCYNGKEEEVTVPEGVTCIKTSAFDQYVKVLRFPDSLEEIEAYAIESADSIYFGTGLIKMADKAVGYRMACEYIMEPDGNDYMAEFEWASDIKLYGPVNSIPEEYAKRNGFSYNDNVICLMDEKELHTKVLGKESLLLYWDSQYLADGYYIYRSEKADGVYQQIADVKQYVAPENFYIIKDCEPGKEYFYQVKSYRRDEKNNTTVISDHAIQASASTKIGERSIYVRTYNSTSLVIGGYEDSYDNEIGGYYLWRADSKNGQYKKIAAIKYTAGKKTASTYIDKNLKLGKTYYYKINAYDPKIKAFDGPLSEAVSATVKVQDMEVPSPTAQRKNENTVQLTWKKNPDADGYVIYRKISTYSSNYSRLAVVSKNHLSYTDTKVTEQDRYYYCVKAYKKYNNKIYYSDRSSEALVDQLVDIQGIQRLFLDRNEKAIVLTWGRFFDDVDGFLIYRKEDTANGKYVKVADIKQSKENIQSYTDKNVKAEVSYRYLVKVYKKLNGKTYYAYTKGSEASVGPYGK